MAQAEKTRITSIKLPESLWKRLGVAGARLALSRAELIREAVAVRIAQIEARAERAK